MFDRFDNVGGGYIKLYRSFLSGGLRPRNGKWNKSEKFLFLLFKASFKDCEVSVGGRSVSIKRGEFITTVAYLAQVWGIAWKNAKAALVTFEAEDRVNLTYMDTYTDPLIVPSTHAKAPGLIVSIVNFDSYQSEGNGGVNDDVDDCVNTGVNKRVRNNKKERNKEIRNKEIIKNSNNKITGRELPISTNRESDLIGSAPTSENQSLPKPLQDFFKTQGKEEVLPNVFMTESEFERLEAEFGSENFKIAARRMFEWSTSLDVSQKTHLPGWKSYRMKRDHNRVMRQQFEIMKQRGEFLNGTDQPR